MNNFMKKTQNRYFYVIGMLLITAILSWKLFGSQPQSYEIRLDEFPLTIGAWQGKKNEMDNLDLVYAVLETKTILSRVYVNSKAENKIVDFFVTYSEKTSRGFHPPEVSYVAQGRRIVKAGIEHIPLAKGENAPMLETNMFLGEDSKGRKSLYIYWFGIGDRLMANYYKSSLYLLWDTMRGKTPPAFMVRVALPLVNNNFDETMVVATDFIQQIVPILPEYLTEQISQE